MKEKLLTYIRENNLFQPDEKILLTVSGGIDSMTMLHLFSECEFNIAIAHCNFLLRGAESDDEQEFVERVAQNKQIAIHINRFDTLKYAEDNKISIQMAARDLRYKWFDRLARENNYAKIATAHNANDVVETFLINLSRGTGIHGLTGINVKNRNIIRPLLFATRSDISNYSVKNSIEYREDSSNAETKYLRNAIRHEIIPLFEKINASFLKAVTNTASILKDAELTFNNNIDNLKKLLLEQENEVIKIDISGLISHSITPAILFEILQPYGFTFDTAIRVLRNISGQPGTEYFSKTHKIIKDRTSYLMLPLNKKEYEEYYIPESNTFFNGPIKLKIERKIVDKHFSIVNNRNVATFDADKLTYPIKLRHWQHGDFFYPFGMRGKKKLSDYFSDQKFSIPEKDQTWLLQSGNDIIWIVNHRTDNRYRVTNNTKKVVQIEWIY